MNRVIAVCALLAAAAPAGAFELALGGGVQVTQDGQGDGALALEARTDPLFTLAETVAIRLAAAGEIETSGDAFAGAGPMLTVPLGAGLRLEGSVMPGAYREGAGDDLGSTIMVRSLVGVSYAVTPSLRLGLAYTHKSNAGLDDRNPGADMVYATLAWTP